MTFNLEDMFLCPYPAGLKNIPHNFPIFFDAAPARANGFAKVKLNTNG